MTLNACIAASELVAARGNAILSVDSLRVSTADLKVNIISEISFSLQRGETIGIAGESGSGKTTLALAVLGHIRRGMTLASGSVRLQGVDLVRLSDTERRALRGRIIAFVSQDPATALNPSRAIGGQLWEVLETHVARKERSPERIREACERAQLPADRQFLRRYPYQLSGGQKQRVTIAMALVGRPSVLVMDEPTTGLDVTTQARLLTVIKNLCRHGDLAMAYVSHDLSVIRNLADRVLIMYGGYGVEFGDVEGLFAAPNHPYTRRLLEAIPRLGQQDQRLREIRGSALDPWTRPTGCPFAPRCEYRTGKCDVEMPPVEVVGHGYVRCWRWREIPDELGRLRIAAQVDVDFRRSPATRPRGGEERTDERPVLQVRDLCAGYGRGTHFWGTYWRKRAVQAVQEVSLTVERGECVGVVGESGSGKTTLLRCLAGLHVPDSGEIRLGGVRTAASVHDRDADARRKIQLIPQNPDSSLNPRKLVREIVGRPLRLFFGLKGEEQRRPVRELLELVKLPASAEARLPRELSGGEKQRVAIARALGANPDLLLCDEITSSLDVAVQAGILNLLLELRKSRGMSMIFVSHDLAVVSIVSDTVVVMKDGRIVESGLTGSLFRRQSAEYTRELISAVRTLRDSDYPHNQS